MDKISGIEEVVQNIESVHRMQEKRLLKYLESASGCLFSQLPEFYLVCKSY